MQKANSLEAPDTSEQQADEAALSQSAPSTGGTPQPPQPGEPPPSKPRGPPQRGDTGHISFGGIVQSPSVASVAANIEAVGPPSGLRVPDLMRVRTISLSNDAWRHHSVFCGHRFVAVCTAVKGIWVLRMLKFQVRYGLAIEAGAATQSSDEAALSGML